MHQADYKGYLVSVYIVWGQDGTFYGEGENTNTGRTRATSNLYNTVEETISASKDLVDAIL